MRDTDEFYDVKISQDIINEKERNVITNSLIKNTEKSINDNNRKWYYNKCFLFSALLLSSIVISTGIYVCFIFC